MADTRRHADAGAGRFAVAVALAAGLVAITAATSAVVIVACSRLIISAPKRRNELVQVLSYNDEAETITLAATPEALIDGEYSFWFAEGSGHARIGDITETSAATSSSEHQIGTVTRRVLEVDTGDISLARRGRFSGWYYRSPAHLGFAYTDVDIATELGPSPAWLIAPATPTGRWVIQIHGRAGSREEGLRAVPVFRNEGYTSLLISYRNDPDAPQTADGFYSLGETEWRDVEAAIRFALERGATDIVLMGWSMGGAIALQAATRSAVREHIRALILESPVVDWVEALNHQGKSRGLPRPIRWGIFGILGTPWARRFAGPGSAIDLSRMNFVRRAAELELPILLLHSANDELVPIGASRALALARPDIVTFEEFEGAGHTKLWNHDKNRFNTAIELWLAGLVLGGR